MRAKCVDRAWIIARCKLAITPILVYIRWCPLWRHTVVWRHGAYFVSMQHSSESDCFIHESWLVYSSSANQCLLSVNLKRFLMQMEQKSKHKNPEFNNQLSILAEEDLPPTLLWSENADLKFNASNQEGDSSNKQRSRENITQRIISNAEVLLRAILKAILGNKPRDMSESRVSKTRFACKRVCNVSAQLGFRSLDVMKCVYVGFLL